MDIYDQATEVETLNRELSMQKRKPIGPEPTGFCLWCGEPVANELRWCQATSQEESCMADWEYHQSRRNKR